MHYSLAEKGEIRRLRKHLIWACVILALVSVVYFFVIIGEAFLAGGEPPSAASTTPIMAIYLWMALTANRLAKALDPRFYYYWTITALLFFPVVNLIAITSLFMNAGRVLADPRIYE